MRRFPALLLVALCATSLATEVVSHGGVYVPPPAPDPPGPPPPPPPNPSFPAGPNTPTPDPGSRVNHPSSPPSGPTSPNGPNGVPSAARTGGPNGTARRNATESDRWETWWSRQRELYLSRRHGTPAPRTSSAPSADPAAIRRSLLPLFASALRDPSPDVADSAAIALGRCVPGGEAGPIVPVLLRTLRHSDRSVQRAAVLALGILGGKDGLAPLSDLALDTEAGRAACGTGGQVDLLIRSEAALALGLTGALEAAAPLTKLALAPESPRELAAAAILALGQSHDAAPAVTISLVRLLEDRTLDREARAQVPIALAHLPGSAARAALPRLVQLLGDRQTADVVARSAAIALGRIGNAEDGEIVDLLTNTAQHDEDLGTCQFALLALGRLYERSNTTEGAALKRRAGAQNFLVEQIRRPVHKALVSYAGFALGLFARGDATFASAAPAAGLVQLRRQLAEACEHEPDPSVQSALALSLALAGAVEAAPMLRKELAAGANPALHGHLALALGMLGDRDSAAPMRRLIADPALPPAARIDVARGLSLLGDVDFEEQLVGLLRGSGDTPSAIAYAKALGLVGSDAAAAALKALAQDATAPSLQRAFAVVSLGLLAEKSALPWNVPYLIDSNPTIPLRPMDEIADIL